MKNTKAYPPVIIIGMHRSGTSVLTRMLESLGLYVGWQKTRTHEAIFFQQISKWLLRQSGSDMENPSSISYLLRDHEVRKLVLKLINCNMNSPRVITYLGVKKYLRHHSPVNLDIPWGWKDPRGTFTLPILLEVFPEAKVIHICRHGVDVASSLLARRNRILSRVTDNLDTYKSLYLLYLMFRAIPRKRRLVDIRCASIEGGFSLWEEYMREARAHVAALNTRAIEVRYEDLLIQPDAMLEQLADFCRLPSSVDVLRKAAGQVKKERAYAYRNNLELSSFAAKVNDRLTAHGYEA